MANFNALCMDTIKNLQLDAGFLATGVLDIVNWDGTFKAAGVSGAKGFQNFKTLGATKGSISINIVPETRNIFEGIDGARGYYKGGTVIDNWDITVKATLTEMTKDNLMLALINPKTETVSGSGTYTGGKYETIQPTLEITKEKHITNLYWIGKMAKTDKPIIIEFQNALNMNGFNISAEDKNTGTYEVEFRPHIDLTKANGTEVPLRIFLPKDTALGRKFEEAEIDTKIIKK